MEIKHTERGFAYLDFEDAYGTKCNIQKSSLATEDAIWFGAKEIGLKQFTPYQGGWKDVPTPSSVEGISYVANNRMHLTRNDVASLLPILAHFVETGDLPSQPLDEADLHNIKLGSFMSEVAEEIERRKLSSTGEVDGNAD